MEIGAYVLAYSDFNEYMYILDQLYTHHIFGIHSPLILCKSRCFTDNGRSIL